MGKIKITLLIIIIIVLILVAVAIVLNIDKIKLGLGDFGKIEIAKEIYGFPAEIKKISNQTLTLEASIPLADASQKPAKGTLKILVGDQTKVIKLKFPETIIDTQKQIYPEGSLSNFSELKAGDKINISSKENLSDKIRAGVKFPVELIYIVEN